MSFEFDLRHPNSAFIKTVWRTRSRLDTTFTSPAESHWDIVVTRQKGTSSLTLKGPETRARLAPVPSEAEFIGIQFQHGCFMPHFPVHELTNGGLTLDNATDKRFWFKGSALEFPSFEDAELFVNELIKRGELVKDPLIEAVLGNEPTDVSLRTVQRRFARVTGLSSNALNQIERARRAAQLLETGTPIPDVAFEMGYADQPHLTRSLKTLTGQTPAQLRKGFD